MMHERGKSDAAIVAVKPANKAERSAAEPVEPRAAIEGNARQYCPAGNAGWNALYPGMFTVRGGQVHTDVLNEIGLGFHWP